jgi:hypothetical protein
MAEEQHRSQFTETLICRCPKTIADAVVQAADRELITKAAYARRAVMSALQRDGFLNNQQGISWAVALSPLAEMLQMQQPITPHTPTQITPTDVTGAYQLATNAANQNYIARLNQQNALWGGLAGIGSAGITVTPKLYEAMHPAAAAASSAATPAASTAAGAPLPILGGTAPAASNALDTTMLGYDAAVPGATTAATAGVPIATDLGAADAGTGLTDALAGTTAATAGTPLATLLGGGAADAGTDASIAGLTDLAAGGAGAAGAADASGMTLADLMPFLFAAWGPFRWQIPQSRLMICLHGSLREFSCLSF